MEKTFYVYIMASVSKVIYTGFTSQLEQRVWQHKNGQGSVFTEKYNVNRLVWYEDTNDPDDAIEMEKRIKRDSSLTMFVLNDYLYWYCHSEMRSIVESVLLKTNSWY